MGRVVIVGYRPKAGKEKELEALMRRHLPVLREQGLVTDRESIAMKARDGTVVEVFEWASEEAMQQAHANDAVRELWQSYGAVCEYVPIAEVEEAQALFSSFAPLD